jgi:hypothetical protein
MTAPEAIYILCALTSIVCAILLIRAYLQTRARLLLWSSLCFAGLMTNNLLLFLDKVVWPDTDMPALVIGRNAAALLGLSLLVFGLIWDSE